MKRTIIAGLTFAVLALSACDRGLVYGERTGFNLAVRADPANSAPLEVNAGLQRRVVGSIPPTSRDADGRPTGDAVNMVSRFGLERTPGGTGEFGATVRISTSFASGGAARAIAGKPEVVRAVTNAPVITLSTDVDKRALDTKLFTFTGQSLENTQRYLNLAEEGGLTPRAGETPVARALDMISNPANATVNAKIAELLNL